MLRRRSRRRFRNNTAGRGNFLPTVASSAHTSTSDTQEYWPMYELFLLPEPGQVMRSSCFTLCSLMAVCWTDASLRLSANWSSQRRSLLATNTSSCQKRFAYLRNLLFRFSSHSQLSRQFAPNTTSDWDALSLPLLMQDSTPNSLRWSHHIPSDRSI